MAIVARVVRVTPGGGKFLYRHSQSWRVTALVAMGTSFRVRLSDGTYETDDVLVGSADTNTSLFLEGNIYLVFQNDSSRDRVGFFCGEEV